MSEPVRSDIGPVGIDRDDEIAGVCLERDRLSAALDTAQQRIAELEAEVRSARFDMTDSERTLSSRLFTCRQQIRGMQQEHDRDCAWIVQMGKERDQAQQQVRDLRAALELVSEEMVQNIQVGDHGTIDYCVFCGVNVETEKHKAECPSVAVEAALAATAEPEAGR